MISYVETGLLGFRRFFPKTVQDRNQAFPQRPLSLFLLVGHFKSRTGGTRYSSQVKDYLKARFDAGEESGLFSRGEWLSRNQIQAHFSRLSVLKRKQGSAQKSPCITLVDADDVVEEEDWLQEVDEVYCHLSESSIQYIMTLTIFVTFIRNRNSAHLMLKC